MATLAGNARSFHEGGDMAGTEPATAAFQSAECTSILLMIVMST